MKAENISNSLNYSFQRYPFNAAEIFASGTKEIIDPFFVPRSQKVEEGLKGSPSGEVGKIAEAELSDSLDLSDSKEPDKNQDGSPLKVEHPHPQEEKRENIPQPAPINIPTPEVNQAPDLEVKLPEIKIEIKAEGKNEILASSEGKTDGVIQKEPEVKKENIVEKPVIVEQIIAEKKEEKAIPIDESVPLKAQVAPIAETPQPITEPAQQKPVVEEKKEEKLESIKEVKPEEGPAPEKKVAEPSEEQKIISPIKEKKVDLNEEKRCDILEQLFNFLKTNEVNPILAGYFAKTIEGICERRKSDLMKYLGIFREHAQNILKHSYNKSIADVIHKLLANEECFRQEETVDEFAEDRQRILHAIIQKMQASSIRDDINNNCSILCNLIEAKQQLNFFISGPVIKEIFDVTASLNPYSITGALTVLTTLNKLKAPPKPAQISNMFSFQMHPGKIIV